MTFVPTTIASAVGDKSQGRPAANKPDDVRKIQALLKKALGLAVPPLKDGVCDAAMKSALAQFQQLWGSSADGTVDPHGQTIKRLDRLANPLELKPISLTKVLEMWKNGKMIADGGGYRIAFTTCDRGPLPAPGKGFTVHLGFPEEKDAIDVTGRPSDDLISKENLGSMLGLFEKLGCWAKPVQCRLYVRFNGKTLSTSGAQVLQAPVQPHNGRILPLDQENNGARLTYQGDPDTHQFYGRMFVQVPGYDKQIFVYAGQFETKPEFRGFDCITYAGAACGASNMHMAASDDLATSLSATPVEYIHKSKDPKTGNDTSIKVQLEQADPAYVKEYFAGASNGYFLMWSGGHVVIVANGEVHEFKASVPSGYCRTEVAKWLAPYKTKKLTVRQLPSNPVRAI